MSLKKHHCVIINILLLSPVLPTFLVYKLFLILKKRPFGKLDRIYAKIIYDNIKVQRRLEKKIFFSMDHFTTSLKSYFRYIHKYECKRVWKAGIKEMFRQIPTHSISGNTLSKTNSVPANFFATART